MCINFNNISVKNHCQNEPNDVNKNFGFPVMIRYMKENIIHFWFLPTRKYTYRLFFPFPKRKFKYQEMCNSIWDSGTLKSHDKNSCNSCTQKSGVCVWYSNGVPPFFQKDLSNAQFRIQNRSLLVKRKWHLQKPFTFCRFHNEIIRKQKECALFL